MRGDRREEDSCSATFRWRIECRRTIRCGRFVPSSIRSCMSSRRSSRVRTRGRDARRFHRSCCCGRLLIQVLYSVRSERMLCEQLEYNLLFRWFVGLGMDDRVWVPTVFT